MERVRIYQKEMSLEEAVNRAVDECIKEGILAQFLKKNKAEVINMSLFEYDEKLHEKTLLELGRETGIQGTVTILKSMGCTNDEIIEKLMGVYELDLAKAKSFLD